MMIPNQDQQSHLFLVRFWSEEVGEAGERKELCGRVQHVLSGEAHTFHDWQVLIDLLQEMAETEQIEAEILENETPDARGGVL
jgi:hypothetical protein